MTTRQAQHDMLVRPTHDERARQDFCQALRAHLFGKVQRGNRTVFDERVHPAFQEQHGRPVEDRHEIRRAMSRDPYYRLYSASLRTTQELMWDAVIDTVERDLPRITQEFLRQSKAAAGSLSLDPELPIPRYHTAVDIHLQPGGYHQDRGDNDVAAGAIYDRAIDVYVNGRYGEYSELMGRTVADYCRQHFPELAPRRILELGCTVGNSTLVYCDAYPEAEVHAIDVGAGCLRYAHARAESLGKTVHFAQQNAESMNYANGSFNLIVSHILFHETSRKAMPAILAECRRLLRPGGVMLHLDLPTHDFIGDDLRSFGWDWEAYNNNETFCAVMRNLDVIDEAVAAGFSRDALSLERSNISWPLLVGRKTGESP